MLSLFLAAALAVQAPAANKTRADEFVGRWNVKITDAEDTFVSAGFQIDRRGDGLVAGLVWKWGSFARVKSAEVQDGVLRMVREEEPGKRDVFEARLESGLLKGTATLADGKVKHFEGRKAPQLSSKKNPKWDKPAQLFDGKTLNGWHLRDAKAKNGWAVVDGELAVVEPKGNADLVSDTSFQDAKLHVEFNVEPKSNSGVYVRGKYEVQILDNPDQKMALDSHGCGAVYSRIPPRSIAAKAAGEWQTMDIAMVGRHINIVLNGTEVVDGEVDGITGGAINPYENEPGPLMLQGDHGKVRFRNITLAKAK